MLKSLNLHNFKSFEDAEVIFCPKINIITGYNHDTCSGNGAGKSSILEALIFALYGVSSVNLNQLPKKGKNTCLAQSSIEIQGKKYDIIRKYPSELSLKVDNAESNAIGINMKQTLINDLIGTYDFFQKFRMLDNSKDINILKYTPGQFKKTLMGFLDNLFDDIRQKLLDQKRERETYNVDKKVYTHYYSDKRFKRLEEGLEQIAIDMDCVKDEQKEHDKEYTELESQIQYCKKMIWHYEQDKKKLNTNKCPLCQSEINNQKRDMLYSKKDSEIFQDKEKIKSIQKDANEAHQKLCEFGRKYGVLSDKRFKVQKLITKLESISKFKDYKFTERDVLLYKEAIKVLDNFAAYYINIWLKNLETIINSLVYELDMKINFELDKGDVKLKIIRLNETLDYEELSSGEKIFLSALFKIAILLQKGENTGLLIIDEGIDNLSSENVIRLINVIERTNFQLILISQHEKVKELIQYNLINVVKENGVSQVIK